MSTTKSKKNLSRKAINFLTRLAEAVLADPKHYNQGSYLRTNDKGEQFGCLAFFAARLRAKTAKALTELTWGDVANTRWDVWDELGLPGAENGGSDVMFSTEYQWPEKFRRQFEQAKGPKGQARAAYNRIMHFIATDGAE